MYMRHCTLKLPWYSLGGGGGGAEGDVWESDIGTNMLIRILIG